ncbi:MAG: hypothetical protein ACHQ6U_09965 [Thermodesulfobacteriota bacterium]
MMLREPTRITFTIEADKRYSLDNITGVYGITMSTVINEAIDYYIGVHYRNAAGVHLVTVEYGDFATD